MFCPRPANAAGGQENLEQFFLSPIGRNATPDEMAEPLILLNSDAARFISGQHWIVDYGYCGEVDVVPRRLREDEVGEPRHGHEQEGERLVLIREVAVEIAVVGRGAGRGSTPAR